jgi:hypothetical protein
MLLTGRLCPLARWFPLAMHQWILWVALDPPQFFHHTTNIVMAPFGKGISVAPDLFENLIFHINEAP